jgi:hypothetical protein
VPPLAYRSRPPGADGEGRHNDRTTPWLLAFEPYPAPAELPERESQTIGSTGKLGSDVAMHVQRNAVCIQDLIVLGGFGGF